MILLSYLAVAEDAHQVEYAVDVTPVEDAPVDYCPASFVVSADDLVEVAVEVVPKPAQVGCAEVDVVPEMVGVAAYAGACVDGHGGVGHELHDADTAVAGDYVLSPAAFLPGDG